MKYYSAIKKKKGSPTICNNMHRPWKHYVKSERGRQILYNFTYMQNLLRKHTHTHTHTQRERKRDQTCGCERQRVKGEGTGGRWSKGENYQIQACLLLFPLTLLHFTDTFFTNSRFASTLKSNKSVIIISTAACAHVMSQCHTLMIVIVICDVTILFSGTVILTHIR